MMSPWRLVSCNMKELRPGTIRVLFASGPKRTAILLTVGDSETSE
jgi:hypothetical protein